MSSMRMAVTAATTVEMVMAAKGSTPTTSRLADPHLVLRRRAREVRTARPPSIPTTPVKPSAVAPSAR